TGAVAALGAACVAVGGVPAGLIAALVCCPATAHALRRLRSRPVKTPDDPALPVTLDLAAAALRSGQPVATALVVAAPAAGDATGQELLRVAGLLRLGADPAQAWGAVDARAGPIDDVARVAIRSSSSGVKLAGAFVELADQLRAERSAQLAVRANRAGIAAMAPLAACYLPSFVCLGVVPAVVGIARSTVGVLP
uniref:type II secretion system F family protein n=1 Tax=uncultured Jatrophihabitans sp. TaxID=1610747 RepID=UPI0035C9EE62